MTKLLATLALLIAPALAHAQARAYRMGVGLQLACQSSAPGKETANASVWCKSTDSNKLYFTTPDGTSAAVGSGGGGGSGDMVLASTQTNTGAKTFNVGTLKLNNAGNTFASTLASSATASRTWTLPDATDTAVGLAASQTLTNKTLTAPLIDGATPTIQATSTTIRLLDSANYGFTVEGSQPRIRIAGVDFWSIYATYITPLTAHTQSLCLHDLDCANVWSDLLTTNLGGALDSTGSNVTIAPTRMLQHVTNAGSVQNITPPVANFVGCIGFWPDGAFTTVTGGNIAKASTAVVDRVLSECFDGTSWAPSY